jgi:hypothetical protein
VASVSPHPKKPKKKKYGLRNDAVSESDYITGNDCMIMNSEVEMMCKEAVVAQFKILSSHFPGGSEENQEHFREQALPTYILTLACSVCSGY